jgi:hypothetical protein
MRRSANRFLYPELPSATHLPSCSRNHELLPKNSNNSPRETTSQNKRIEIWVCNLACAARFRANAGAKSVGMFDGR